MSTAVARRQKLGRFPGARAVLRELLAHPTMKVWPCAPESCPLAKCSGYVVDVDLYYLTGEDLAEETKGKRLPDWAIRFVKAFDDEDRVMTAKEAARILRDVLRERR